MTDRELLQMAIDFGKANPDGNKCVGAVIAYEGRAVSMGHRHTMPGYCGYVDRTIHAEHMAILLALEWNSSVLNTTLYVSMEPCTVRRLSDDWYPDILSCVDHIVMNKIPRVVFAEPDNWVGAGGAEALRKAGIEVVHLPIERS